MGIRVIIEITEKDHTVSRCENYNPAKNLDADALGYLIGDSIRGVEHHIVAGKRMISNIYESLARSPIIGEQ